MLKMTKIELQKISDPDMHIFTEEGMRGGICYAAKRYSEASNDLSKPKIQIKYYDMNNLYGKAVMEYLPYGNFRWIKVTDKNIDIALNKRELFAWIFFRSRHILSR